MLRCPGLSACVLSGQRKGSQLVCLHPTTGVFERVDGLESLPEKLDGNHNLKYFFEERRKVKMFGFLLFPSIPPSPSSLPCFSTPTGVKVLRWDGSSNRLTSKF